MTATVIVPLAPGFEEIEAVTVIDVLRRAGIDVVVAGLEHGAITGSHGITIQTDATIAAVADLSPNMVVLPGGLPGSNHLRDDEHVQKLLRRQRDEGRAVAAICAAPIALSPSEWSTKRTVTSYPGFDDQITCHEYVDDRVVVDGPLVTSRGPGTALEFALTLVERLVGPETATKLEGGMLVRRDEARVVSPS